MNITKVELLALRQAKSILGRTWKAQIRLSWENGNYDPNLVQYRAHLQTVRNKIGPSGLAKIKI